MCDVLQSRLTEVRTRAVFAADAAGRAIKCVSTAGTTRTYAGFAQAPASALGEIVPMLVAPGLMEAP
jgi:hypothetical protein